MLIGKAHSDVNILLQLNFFYKKMNLIGLALQIIKLYPKLVNSVNRDGLSPLQVLAGKPNCFKSSTRMELLQSIIYNCKNII